PIVTPVRLLTRAKGLSISPIPISMTYIMLPFIILPLYGVIKKIDPSTLQAAALCGANRWQCLTRVLLPVAMPGMAAGAL
ncbi:ABC transporter permease subunit, partial [Rhizobium ruizarguesonis]